MALSSRFQRCLLRLGRLLYSYIGFAEVYWSTMYLGRFFVVGSQDRILRMSEDQLVIQSLKMEKNAESCLLIWSMFVKDVFYCQLTKYKRSYGYIDSRAVVQVAGCFMPLLLNSMKGFGTSECVWKVRGLNASSYTYVFYPVFSTSGQGVLCLIVLRICPFHCVGPQMALIK